MTIASILFWFVILCVKFNRFRLWWVDLHHESKNKFVVVLSLFYKSPYFWLWLAAIPYRVVTKMEAFGHAMYYQPLWYLGPTIFCLVVWHLQAKNYFGKGEAGDKEHVRGSLLSEEPALAKALFKVTDDGCIALTLKVRIPFQYETTHFFAIGRPGCGKSQLFYRIIQKVMNRGDKAIIYDFKGDQVAKFFDPDKHILFNPFDKRCAPWNIFNEIESPLDIRSIANSLIPITGNDPYWSNAARDVFAGILTACYQAGRKTNDDVYRCSSMPAHELKDFLSRQAGTELATRHLAQEKAGASILSIMSSSTQCFEYLRNIKGDFSIRKWASDDSDRRSVFLTNYTEISDTIRPALSLFVELAGKRVLSLADNLQRRFFFFIDEFGTLNNLPTIPTMLTNGRSKGMSIWIAIQDMGQMEKVYGKDISQTIINACATSFAFAVNDPSTADFISRKIGEREIRQVNVSQSQGADIKSSTTTTSYQTANERVVMASEIQNLPNLVFLLKMPDYDVTPLRLDIVSIPDREPAFVVRDDFRLAARTQELNPSPKIWDWPEQPKQPRESDEEDYHL